MKRILLALCVLVLVSTGTLFADVTITVTPSLAPNGYGSPSYAGWRTNAIYALMHGLSEYGDPLSPTFYQAAPSSISQADVTVTSYPSWMGKADPGTVFGAAFAHELGNRLLFGLLIDGNGSQFSISQLSAHTYSTDPANALGWDWAAGGYNYGPDYVGVQKGVDGVLWTADDVFVTTGVNTQLVDGLVGRGSGNAYWPCYGETCTTIAQQQAAIDAVAAYNGPNPYDYVGVYSLGGVSGQAGVEIVPTPEPISLALFGTVLAGLAVKFRRRK